MPLLDGGSGEKNATRINEITSALRGRSGSGDDAEARRRRGAWVRPPAEEKSLLQLHRKGAQWGRDLGEQRRPHTILGEKDLDVQIRRGTLNACQDPLRLDILLAHPDRLLALIFDAHIVNRAVNHLLRGRQSS